MELSKQKIELFFLFPGLLSKTPFTKCFPFDPKGSNSIFETRNGFIQTGNGIIFPTSLPQIKKLLLQNISHFYQGFQKQFPIQKIQLSKKEMELFLLLPDLR